MTIDKYENFVTTYIEAEVEGIPTNPSAKCKVLCESIAFKEKPDNF